ncbi:hypothetical protein PAENIP36_15310 [Paenibacillus sp. P36]
MNYVRCQGIIGAQAYPRSKDYHGVLFSPTVPLGTSNSGKTPVSIYRIRLVIVYAFSTTAQAAQQ